MKLIPILLVLTLLFTVLFSGCGPSEKYASGPEFVQALIDSVGLKWNGTPPAGGEKPRILTPDEQQKLLKTAGAFQAVKEWKNKKDVTSVDSSFTWIGWVGISNGESFLDYQPIVDGSVPQSTIDNMGDCFPGVSFLFHSKYGDTGIAGIRVAIDLKNNIVVFSQGFNASKILPSELPAAN